MKTDPIDSAFPLQSPPYMVGLTKREYFAAMAMQGYLANPHAWEEWTPSKVAYESTIVADALIAALNKPVSQ